MSSARAAGRSHMGWMLISLAATVAALAPAFQSQGWRDLDGKPCPRIEAETWINTGGATPSTAGLKGKVFLIAFFTTTEPACLARVETLSRLHEAYFSLGLRVIVFSGEPASTLEQRFVEQRGARFWIGSDAKDRTLGRFSDGTILVPHYYLIDTEGTVVDDVLASPDQIVELLAQRFEGKLERELDPKLAKARVAYDGGCFGAAWKSARRLADDKDGIVAADACFLRDRIEECARLRRALLEVRLETASSAGAYGDLMLFEHRFAGLDGARWASAKRRKLASEASVKGERKAWKAFESALKKEMTAAGDGRKRARVLEAYRQVAAQHPRAYASALANEAMERLGP